MPKKQHSDVINPFSLIRELLLCTGKELGFSKQFAEDKAGKSVDVVREEERALSVASLASLNSITTVIALPIIRFWINLDWHKGKPSAQSPFHTGNSNGEI